MDVVDREIRWHGFHNARDLGGLPTRAGRVTRRGALIRSADLRFVSADGWRAAYGAGLRTIVDLRNDDEVCAGAGPPLTTLVGSAQFPSATEAPAVPAGMRRVHLPLDGVEDTEFWQYVNAERLNGTPHYYRPFLDRKPDRCAALFTALAAAPPGGILFHCGAGRDRTGLVTLLLLALADVDPEIIAADHELTTEPLRALSAAMGVEDRTLGPARILAERQTTAREAILATLHGFDVKAYLQTAGVSSETLAAVKTRLVA